MEQKISIVKKGEYDGNLLYWLSLTFNQRMAEWEKMRQKRCSKKF